MTLVLDTNPSISPNPSSVEVRKLLTVGNKGHAVSLPSKWYKTLGFNKNDLVRMQLLDNRVIIQRMPIVSEID